MTFRVNGDKLYCSSGEGSEKLETYVEFIKENINTADLVVWDDIATKTSTNFEIDNILPYITGRMYAGKANIYTSNLSPDGLYEALGKQIASRVANESKIINLKGADKRFLKVQ